MWLSESDIPPGHVRAASDKCQREKRKTIMGDDLLWAMSTLGFENYTEPLKTYLFRYREVSVKEQKAGSSPKTQPPPPNGGAPTGPAEPMA